MKKMSVARISLNKKVKMKERYFKQEVCRVIELEKEGRAVLQFPILYRKIFGNVLRINFVLKYQYPTYI